MIELTFVRQLVRGVILLLVGNPIHIVFVGSSVGNVEISLVRGVIPSYLSAFKPGDSMGKLTYPHVCHGQNLGKLW